MIRLLVIDNRDSFVFNIVQLLRELPDISYELRQEEALAEEQLEGYDGLILSPGPGLPRDYPEMLRLVRLALDRGLPLLGVCLGHQALAETLGAQLYQLERPLHGHASQLVQLVADPILGTEACGRIIGRYHSWAVEAKSLPSCLEATALSGPLSADGHEEPVVMALRHRSRPAFGLQFHPESMISQEGAGYLERFVALIAARLGQGASLDQRIDYVLP